MNKNILHITDQQLIDSYNELKSGWAVAKKYNINGHMFYKRLKKINFIFNKNLWDNNEIIKLKKLYIEYDGNIRKISTIINRTYAAIACKANELKITDYHRKAEDDTIKKMSNCTKKRIKEKGHPRGMLNKHHSKESKENMSKTRTGVKLNLSEEKRQNRSDRMSKMIRNNNNYSRCKRGYYNIDGKIMYFRSSWEPIYAQYLNILIKIKAIVSWEYESDTFWFEKIKRGIRSYTPDFKIIHIDGSIEYHEVKGWMDDKSQTKIKRMKIYFPEIKMIIIGEKEFYGLKKKWNLEKLKMVDKD
jgi:hypothetical protein